MRIFGLLIGALRGPASSGSWMDELPAVQIVHGERRRIGGDLRQVLLLALDLGRKSQLADALLDRLDQRADEGPLHAGPVGDLVDERLAGLADQVRSRTDAPLAALAADEDVHEVRVQRQLDGPRLVRRLVELLD